MIVEDEPIVLEGMLKIIDFNDLGFEVVSACSKGKEALDRFDETPPDVVITDICMDIMDGLEFIENVKDKKRDTKFVIVSGHQDFKFFKKALSLKVSDYILKPVTAKEFRELLTKIAHELDEKKIDNKRLEEIEKNANETFELQKNIFLNELMNLKFNEKELIENLEKFKIQFKKRYYQVSIYKMQDMHLTRKKIGFKSSSLLLNNIYNQIINITQENDQTVTFIDPKGSVIVIANSDSTENIKKISIDISKIIYHHYLDEDSAKINCYAGIYAKNMMSISNSFDSASKLLINGVLDSGSGYYDANIILEKRKNKTYDYSQDMNDWIRKIIYADKSSIDVMNNIKLRIKIADFLLSDYKALGTKMIDALKKELNTIGINNISLDSNFEQYNEKELNEYILDKTNTCIEAIKEMNNNKESYIANKAIEYIHQNYADTDLDLQHICKHLNISVSYFSSVFKNETNMTFIKYLNNYRIEKAMYFLEYSQKSISEISEMAGYVDPHYFGIVFKKHVKITPKEYRRQKRR
jgi:two-component system response regulator YesN